MHALFLNFPVIHFTDHHHHQPAMVGVYKTIAGAVCSTQFRCELESFKLKLSEMLACSGAGGGGWVVE
jgi:hypothetical protein